MSTSTVPVQCIMYVCSEITKCIIHTINNVDQPWFWILHQNDRSSRGNQAWANDPLELPSVWLCSRYHLYQRGDPSSLEQGTLQCQHGHPQHTDERHCVHSVVYKRNRLTTDHHLYTHAGCTPQDEEGISG